MTFAGSHPGGGGGLPRCTPRKRDDPSSSRRCIFAAALSRPIRSASCRQPSARKSSLAAAAAGRREGGKCLVGNIPTMVESEDEGEALEQQRASVPEPVWRYDRDTGSARRQTISFQAVGVEYAHYKGEEVRAEVLYNQNGRRVAGDARLSFHVFSTAGLGGPHWEFEDPSPRWARSVSNNSQCMVKNWYFRNGRHRDTRRQKFC